ncbi:FYVE zinc finger domain-containing protein, partial [Acetobacter pasteurianus]|nr:FYVE zinc finger domain-containing protein [Acetobacter pasteurianus]
TLADPEVFTDRGVSGIISKTLRKVTMNASKLVENYSSNFESPKSARSNGLENSPSTPKALGLGLGMGATHPIDTVDATSINFDKLLLPHQYQQNRDHLKNPIKSGSILHGKSSVPNLQGVSSRSEHKLNKKLTGKIGNSHNDTMSNRGRGHGYGSLLQTSRDQMKQPDFLLAQQSLRPTVGISTTPNFKHELVDNEAMVKNTKLEGLIKDNTSAMPSKDTNAINESLREMSHRIHTLPSDISKIRKTQPPLSKVTSDNKSLRLSAAHFPTSLYINSSATSSVVNVNASATVEFSERPGETNAAKTKASKGEKALSDVRLREKQLRAKASTLFTNLPNDIEISDDSASDSDTIESHKDDENSKTDTASYENYQRHLNTHRHFNNSNNTNNNQHSSHHQLLLGNLSSSRNTSQDTSRKTSVNSVKTQYEPGLGFAATVGKSSPIKGEILGKATFTTKMGNSPTITSFQALQSKDHRAIKRKSGNFSTQILDNAKSLINQNIGAVASSASSIVARRKKKKKKPRKISENPLKNGGIPKKYWMNDAYVTDCLNCFKPFTAFRRKHHCRFCGQIFCSDCMLFVSYNQHKDERRNLDKKPTYNDKLRVCKPCYSDVIIYLSDDSSSSSSSASSSILNEERAEIGMDGSDYAIDEVQSLEKRGNELLVPNHPLARIRSLSTSTHKEGPSLLHENQRSQYDDSMKNTDSLSACNSDSPSSHSNSQRIYPDDSIKSNLKQAPRMAIPTTRAGESVEIPIVRSSLSNMSIPRYGSSLKIETLSSNNPLQHSHLNHFNSTLKHHTNIHFQRQLHDLTDSPSSSKAWTTHASKSIIPDVPFSQSYENPSSFIRAPVSRKPSLKLRLRLELQNCSSNLYDKTVECNSDDNESTTSESSEDVDQTRSRIHLNRHHSNHLSRTYSTGEAGAEAGAEEEEEKEEEKEKEKERRKER